MVEENIEEGEVLTSFNVTALFTSVHGKEVVEMVVKRAKKTPTWCKRTVMPFEKFGELLLNVVETTYFRFQGKIFEQMCGMFMGSPLSLGLSNLFVEKC